MRKNVGDLVKVAILVGCLLPLSVMAKRGLFPGGCRDTGYSFKLYVLMLHPEAKGDVQSLYFMHNKSGRKLKLSQMKVSRDKPYTLYLNNVIKPNKWGVFATDSPVVKFVCSVPVRGNPHGKVVDCKKSLDICEYTNVKFADNNYGNYWGVKSKAKISARNDIIRQGVLLKW
jgi:hypothetical protein